MRKFVLIIFFILAGLVLTGFFFRTQDIAEANMYFSLGLLGLLVSNTLKVIKDIENNRFDKIKSILQILIVLMSVILFSKYLYHRFGDYPALLIIPIYIFASIFYLLKEKSKDLELTTTIILYLLLTVPLFAFDFYRSPRQYIPLEWYNRYDVDEGIPINLPYGFDKKETEELSIKAFQLTNSKLYNDAIPILRNAVNIEPKNPRLYFDLSQCYAFTNNLEKAIELLDTAINLSDQFAPFYNNRGLLYYKLKQNDKAVADFEFSIKLDSMNSTYFYNLALALYYQERYEESCQALRNSEHLGLDSKYKMIKRIKRKCE